MFTLYIRSAGHVDVMYLMVTTCVQTAKMWYIKLAHSDSKKS